MAADSSDFHPDWSIPPGEILAEALEERGMSQAELARRMDRPLKTINEIVNGKASITADTAVQLESVLSIPARFWLSLAHLYEELQARARQHAQLEDAAGWAARFPLTELRRHGLISKKRDGSQLAKSLLEFFGVSSPTGWDRQWKAQRASFRASPTLPASDAALSAWLRWGELKALQMVLPAFNERRADEVLDELRRATQLDPDDAIDTAQGLLSSAGIALVLLPPFSGMPIGGATRWIGGSRPVIQLSLRGGTDDQFWYSLFHELGHLLAGNRRAIYVDSSDSRGESPDEEVADAFARDKLVQPSAYARLSEGSLSEARIRKVAEDVGVAPGIVVGRLQHDGRLPWNAYRSLKRPVKWRVD